MNGKLLMVIPPVVRAVNGVVEIEADFANNLKIYLRNFDHVTFACPVIIGGRDSGILRSVPLADITNHDRLSFIALPYTYREDRYILYYLTTKKLLRSEIAKADYLSFSPHAKYDWPSLAMLEAIRMKRKYNIESDWDHESVQRLNLAKLPWGFNKIRKTFWMHSFLRAVKIGFSQSALALLQGQDVFDAYKDIAPNPRKVLNVQVSREDCLSPSQLEEKLAHVRRGGVLTIAYAGRMIEMKGPFDWLRALYAAINAGVELRATWFGDGSLMSQVRDEVERLGIGTKVALEGVVGRDAIMDKLGKTDVFLFCHKTGESPRCLGEALARGCALVGYGTAYPRDLVASQGGGEFAALGDWKGLAELISQLDRDRKRLCRLIEGAAASGRALDRDAAMQSRIDLIKTHLCGATALN